MMENEKQDPNKWWHRRRMVWTSFISLIGFGFSALIVDITEPQSSVLQMVIFVLGGIVGAYFGLVTAEDNWKPKQ